MKTALLGLSLACVVGIVQSCNPFSPDQSVTLGVAQLEAPATIVAGTPLSVVLTVELGGCKSFERIVTERTPQHATLTVLGSDASKGRDVSCPANYFTEPHTVQLDPPFSNPFTITVNRGRVSPLTATVQVQ